MHRFEAFSACLSLRARVLLMLVPLTACVLALGAGAGQARTTDAPPAATRDHGRGHWFRHTCSRPNARFAWCGAQVVTNADGQPLAAGSPPASAITPAGFHAAYSLPTTAASGTPTIAIVDAYDDPNIEADLAVYSQQFGLPPCTTANGCFRKVDQNGGTNYPTGTSWHLEIALDVEVAHAICQNCKILLVEAASNSLQNLGIAVNTAVALGASVVSNSYGAGEFSGQTSYENAYFKHPGVAITASSGDSGYGVEFPAASQYVTAVGGTTLSLNADKTWKSETVWNGAGSGCSLYEPKPAWQTDTGCSRRTVADVSADADPNTGAAIYDSVGVASGQGWYQVGGTSLAAPLVGAVYALTGTTTTYGSAPYGKTAFLNDVVSGSNGTCTPAYLCTGGAGYDGPSGLGTPRGLGAFGAAAAPTPDYALSVTPSSAPAVQGKAATYTVSVSPSNGFSGTVAFGTTGLPAGAAAGLSPGSSTTGTTVTVTTAASLAPGAYPFTITSSSGSLSHSVAATLVVQQAPDFSLSLTPSSQTVTQGGQTTYTVGVTPVAGFSGTVTYAVSGLPSGATGTFSGSTLTVTTTAGATTGTFPFTVTGTSGTLSHTTGGTLVIQPGAPADFALSAPASQTVTAGGQTTYAVTITPSGGFGGQVSLATQALPSGITASFSPNPATTASTLTVTVAATVAPASYPVTITGTSGSLTHSTGVTLVVKAAATPDFSLAAPASKTVTAGGQATYGVTITPSNGFNGSVTLGVPSMPTGITASFSPNPATASSTLTVTASASVAAGSYPLTISGTSGTLSHSIAVTLVVQSPPDFALALSPASQTVTAGGQTTYTATIAATNGFAGLVALTASGLPAGATATFNPVAPTTSSTLTVATTSAVPAGTYPFMVTGTSGGLVHTAAGTLVVTTAAGATLSVSPTTAPRGTSVTVTWSGVASPTSRDWIGIFNPGAPNTAYLSYKYDSSCFAGWVSSPRSSGSCSFRLPSTPGTYEFRLMANNGFTPIVTGVLVVAS